MVDNNTTANNIINLLNNTNRPSSSTTDHNNNSANLLSLIINQDHHHHHHHHHHDDGDSSGIFQEQLLLPIANVGRMMKQAVPANAKVSKEAKERVQECATEFLSFVTAEASDRCRRERRKTLNGDDVCWALQALGFDDYAAPLRLYLHRYRHAQQQPHHHRANAQDHQTRPTNAAAAAADVDGNKGGRDGDGSEE